MGRTPSIRFVSLAYYCFYLHAGSPNPALQRDDDDRYIVMVSPTITMWYLDQFMKVHSCFVGSTEKNFLHKMLGRVAFRGCCDEHFDLSNCLLVGEILVKSI